MSEPLTPEIIAKLMAEWLEKRLHEIHEEFWKDPVGNTLNSWRKEQEYKKETNS